METWVQRLACFLFRGHQYYSLIPTEELLDEDNIRYAIISVLRCDDCGKIKTIVIWST